MGIGFGKMRVLDSSGAIEALFRLMTGIENCNARRITLVRVDHLPRSFDSLFILSMDFKQRG
jgi:hypothetical protein